VIRQRVQVPADGVCNRPVLALIADDALIGREDDNLSRYRDADELRGSGTFDDLDDFLARIEALRRESYESVASRRGTV